MDERIIDLLEGETVVIISDSDAMIIRAKLRKYKKNAEIVLSQLAERLKKSPGVKK